MTGLPCSHLLWVQLSKYGKGTSRTIFKEEWLRTRFRYTLITPELTREEAQTMLRPSVEQQPAQAGKTVVETPGGEPARSASGLTY